MAGSRTQTVLPSAARTATTVTDEVQAAVGSRGVLIYLNLSVRGAAETITPTIQIKDPVTNTWIAYAALTATAAVGEYAWLVGPYATGAGTATAGKDAGIALVAVPMPSRWRLSLVHSGSTAHTYSVAVEDLN